MRHWAHYVRAGSWALALSLLGNFAAPALARAAATATLSQQTALLQRSDIQVGDDGSLKLLANAPPAPAIYGSFKHFGLALPSAHSRSTIPQQRPLEAVCAWMRASAPMAGAGAAGRSICPAARV